MVFCVVEGHCPARQEFWDLRKLRRCLELVMFGER